MIDTNLCALAAASYDQNPTGLIVDWRDVRAVATGSVLAIRGTEPDNIPNWLRDFAVWGHLAAQHPRLGVCSEGALAAALGLLGHPYLDQVTTITGHSLGGQIAACLAGLLVSQGRSVELVTWDAPKPGDSQLASLLAGSPVRQYRFRGSKVTDWPVLRYQHVREPLIDIGDWVPNVITAHSITRALAWVQAH